MTQIGNVYGQALYDLAREEGLSEEILGEVKVLSQSFTAEPEFLRLLSAPGIPRQERRRILDNSFRGKIQPYLLNFLKILAEKGYMRHFPDCVAAYRELYNADHGILPVTVTTAVELQPQQAERLKQKLAGITGKTIELNLRIDPACLGGVRLDYDGKRVEDTVAHRLESIRSLLKNTVL